MRFSVSTLLAPHLDLRASSVFANRRTMGRNGTLPQLAVRIACLLLVLAVQPAAYAAPRTGPMVRASVVDIAGGGSGPNSCQSPFDAFYAMEPGVYGYWALCEAGSNPAISDYTGAWSVPSSAISGSLTGGVAGPSGDGETAVQALTTGSQVRGQGISLNEGGGVFAAWVNADGGNGQVDAVSLQAAGGKSGIAIRVSGSNGTVCYSGDWTNSAGSNSEVSQCGYSASAWHRVVLSWGGSFMALAVDGNVQTVSMYHGSLDGGLFAYKLFGGTGNSPKQIALAKVVVSNQSWNGTQIQIDFAPPVVMPVVAVVAMGGGPNPGVPTKPCVSAYDSFYQTEPGVTALWPLCETGALAALGDYSGSATLAANAGPGSLAGGVAGPVPDLEGGLQATTPAAQIQGQGVGLATNSGVLAAWINADLFTTPATAVAAHAGAGMSSGVSLGSRANGSAVCFYGNWTNSAGSTSSVSQCGFSANTWHRVALSWGNSFMALAVDGNVQTVSMYHGSLDAGPFTYTLFPGAGSDAKQMGLAKVLVSSQGWNGTQIATDYAPRIAPKVAKVIPVATQLLFTTQPGNTTTNGVVLPVTLQIADASGNAMESAVNPIVMNLAANAGNAALGGTVNLAASAGQATFNGLTVGVPGASYQLVASSAGLTSATSSAFTVLPAPTSAAAVAVPANGCSSYYDRYYSAEPGVYAYWAMCEGGSNPGVLDYVGQWALAGGWGWGNTIGGVPGPVADGETAIQAASANVSLESQDIPLNTNAGTVALWINADATGYGVTAIWFNAIGKSSGVSLGVSSNGGSVCYNGSWTNAGGTSANVTQCGYVPNTWHRVALVWSGGNLALSVDGAVRANTSYTGALDNTIFFYRLFPSCCDTGKQMTLAKIVVANQAWNGAQLSADYAPTLITPPAGGVYISTSQMGTIHRDVLGLADNNQDISSASLVTALKTGITAAGVTSMRYAGGFGGITADLADWQHGALQCSGNPGSVIPAQNAGTGDYIDNYIPQVAQPLNLHLGYTVNYGTNAPLCNAGGDPVLNGANLVDYVNNKKHYGFKYFEIGNEQYSGNSETDMHPNGGTGASYVKYEPAFYDAMKAKDPSIQIGVPVAGAGDYDYQTGFDFPVLAGAKYDAIVFHAYPLQDPVSDKNALYQDRVSTPTGIRGPLLTVQTELLNAGKSPEAIWITEWSSTVGGSKWSKQTMGAVAPLFAVTELAEFMQAGVQYATWWAQGMTDVCSAYNYDYSGDGAYSWWNCGSTAMVYTGWVGGSAGEVSVGFKPGDLTPVGRGFQLLAQSGFVTEGEHMLRTQTDLIGAPWLEGYAATHSGSYAVILINRDRDTVHTVPVKLGGKTAGTTVTQYSYGRAQYDQTYFGNWSVGPVQATSGTWNGTFQATLQPWSVNVFVFGN